jgi:hypothetical protein
MESAEILASDVVTAIREDALTRARGGKSRAWTRAIWDSLKDLAVKHKLDLYPKDGPYKGEFLLDFVLWEPGYGPRVGIESQWQHWRLEPREALGWAFDKLLGVKGDLKVLVFDWDGLNTDQLPREVENVLRERLSSYQMYSASEHYLFVWFEREQSEVFEWKPTKQTGQYSANEVQFSPRRKAQT